eukprot:Polyplicarium_translucidae@DN3219_c0_g2_i1.p1
MASGMTRVADSSPSKTEVFVWQLPKTAAMWSLPMPRSFATHRPVCSLSCGETVAAFVTGDGNAFCWWIDECLSEVRAPNLISELPQNRVASVSCGASHFACLTDDGRLFTLGANGHGQLGGGFFGADLNGRSPVTVCDNESKSQFVMSPVFVDVGESVTSVSCGWSHTLFTTRTGRQLGMGRNSSGCLGFPCTAPSSSPSNVTTDSCWSAPRQIALPPVKVAAAGVAHSLFLAESGVVFACGRNDSGQLGLGDFRVRSCPQAVERLSKFANAAIV